jgi:RNA polymerase sigma-70 factor (ECF subfamily)
LPWLLGVARNLLLKQRDNGLRRRALVDRIIALTTGADLVAWDVADHVVERDSALAAIARLPDGDLELLSLVMWHGLAPREAAQVVGCSTATFFVRLHRARRRLTRAIDSAPTPRTHRPASRVADQASR